MKYTCFICKHQFSFEDIISFCPYCGSRLADDKLTGSQNVERMLDTLWGETSKIKQEFLRVINSCIDSINYFAENEIKQALPTEDISQYEKNYHIIKNSNNRKTLIGRIQTYLNYLETIIDNLSDSLPADTTSRLERITLEVRKMTKELYDMLGIAYPIPAANTLLYEKKSVQVIYSREQLKELYLQVQKAFAKYIKCVEDNNMFAAFASDSDYGTIHYGWRSWFSDLSEEGKAIAETADPQEEYQDVMDFITSQNKQPYWGILDEDFTPHVDAFWYSLEKLCTFIDRHIVIDRDLTWLNLASDTASKLSRVIRSYDFTVTETRLESAIVLQEQLARRAYRDNKD